MMFSIRDKIWKTDFSRFKANVVLRDKNSISFQITTVVQCVVS